MAGNVLAMLAEERAELEAALREVDNCFVGRDPEGAPAGDGTYWVGHTTALRVWYALHPEKLPDVTSDLGF